MSAPVDSSSRSVLISGGTVATDYGQFDADLLIVDGRIAALRQRPERRFTAPTR